MTDPHLATKIASIDCIRVLNGFEQAFKDRNEPIPEEVRGDLLKKRKELERRKTP